MQQRGQLVVGADAVVGREVEEDREDTSPLDVTEELVSEPPAVGGPFDQPWDVGDDHLEVVVDTDDGRQHLIPTAREFVTDIDLDGRHAEVGRYHTQKPRLDAVASNPTIHDALLEVCREVAAVYRVPEIEEPSS